MGTPCPRTVTGFCRCFAFRIGKIRGHNGIIRNFQFRKFLPMKSNGKLPYIWKRIDFENGTITGNILGAALPMLVAQILNLLYNIVDRIYIARIPEIGTAALGAVGLCFSDHCHHHSLQQPLWDRRCAALFSIFRGKKDLTRQRRIMNTSFTMLCVCAMILMAVGFLFARPILILFGASAGAIVYAYPYMMLYLIGTLPSMIAVGMNPFINAQGYSSIGMLSVAIGAEQTLWYLIRSLFLPSDSVSAARYRHRDLSACPPPSSCFPHEKIRVEAAVSSKMRSRNVPGTRKISPSASALSRIYHAAHKQSRDDLLQQYPFRHRRRYLYLRHDYHLQCAPAC